MAINTYLSRVKLVQAATIANLETAINAFMSDSYTGDDALQTGEVVTAVDVDVTTVRDVPESVSLFIATISICGSSD